MILDRSLFWNGSERIDRTRLESELGQILPRTGCFRGPVSEPVSGMFWITLIHFCSSVLRQPLCFLSQVSLSLFVCLFVCLFFYDIQNQTVATVTGNTKIDISKANPQHVYVVSVYMTISMYTSNKLDENKYISPKTGLLKKTDLSAPVLSLMLEAVFVKDNSFCATLDESLLAYF